MSSCGKNTVESIPVETVPRQSARLIRGYIEAVVVSLMKSVPRPKTSNRKHIIVNGQYSLNYSAFNVRPTYRSPTSGGFLSGTITSCINRNILSIFGDDDHCVYEALMWAWYFRCAILKFASERQKQKRFAEYQ